MTILPDCALNGDMHAEVVRFMFDLIYNYIQVPNYEAESVFSCALRRSEGINPSRIFPFFDLGKEKAESF